MELSSWYLRLRDSRDNDAWSEFVAVYAPLVHHYLRSRCLQEADAADLTQDVLITMIRNLDSFHGDARFGTSGCVYHHRASWLVTDRTRDGGQTLPNGFDGSAMGIDQTVA